MKILIACEESQRVCLAFRHKGHEAYSADIQEPATGSKWFDYGADRQKNISKTFVCIAEAMAEQWG